MGLVLTTILYALALIATTEVMYRYGRFRSKHYDDKRGSQLSTVQAATLGLLALVLGFTMSMAEARFNARRQVLLAEANAIGTAYLRLDYLPEPARTHGRELFRGYVAARRAYYEASTNEAPASTARSQAILAELWSDAAGLARQHPDWDVLATYIESLNETIDLEATRDLAIGARVPILIEGLLALVAFTAMGITGFATGVSRARTALSLYVIPILIALACGVIVDLDRTRFGLMSSGDRPMQRLQKQLQKDVGPASASR